MTVTTVFAVAIEAHAGTVEVAHIEAHNASQAMALVAAANGTSIRNAQVVRSL
jgi:hypothetical protein